jgi:hypothetical protein
LQLGANETELLHRRLPVGLVGRAAPDLKLHPTKIVLRNPDQLDELGALPFVVPWPDAAAKFVTRRECRSRRGGSSADHD